MAEGVGAGAPADGRFVSALGGAGAESVVSGRLAEPLRAQEQLAGSGVGWRSIALWDAVPAGPGALGRDCGAGATQRVREGRTGQCGCSADSGRDRLSEEGRSFRRSATPVQRYGRADREQSSRVFLCYASTRGQVLLDRELYLPQPWIEDGARCRAAGIPEEVEFATKPMLGRRMLERAFATGMPAGWVAGDEVYGRDSKLRRWLEERRQPYVLAVAADQRLWRPDLRQHRVDEIAGTLPKRAWKRLSAGQVAKGERLYDWPFYSGLNTRAGNTLCWCGAVWNRNLSMLSISPMPEKSKAP